MKRSVLAGCALCCVLFLFCSCVGNSTEKKTALQQNGTQNAANTEKLHTDDVLDLCIYQTDTLNPLATSVKHNAEVLSLMYDSLFTISSDFSAVSNIAESNAVSADGLTYTVKIRDGVRFHNDVLLTAEDVVASINTILSSNGYYKNRLNMIKGAAAKKDHVEIYLNKPTANLSALLDFPILPNGGADIEQKNSNVLLRVAPGSGLYKVTEYHLNKDICLTVNRSHHSGIMPYIETIVIHFAPDRETAVTMLENSKIDMLTGDAANIDAYTPKKQLSVHAYNGCRFFFVGMNTKEHPTNTQKVRSAVSAAINREDILSSGNFDAVISSVPIHPNAYLYSADTDLYGINQSGASGLLAAEGWTDSDGNGILDKTVLYEKYELSFELLVNEESPSKVSIAQSIQKSLSTLGVNIKIRTLPFQTYAANIASGDYDFFLGEANLLPNFDFDDIMTFSNVSHSDDTLVTLLNEAQTTVDSIKQKETYAQLLRHYCALCPMTGLFFKNEVLLFDDHFNVENITTQNPYQSIRTWSVLN